MTVSEMITQLQHILLNDGDLECVDPDDDQMSIEVVDGVAVFES